MMKTGWLAYGLLILFLSVYTTRAQSLFINEMQSSNDITLLDEDDESSDWLEIYNAGGTARNLEGYSLTDDEDRPRRWIFPAVSIPAGGFELIFASGKDRYERPLHTNFSLKAAGEPLFLFDPDGELVDSFPEIPIPRDISLGRFPDGTGAPRLMDTPTPGLPNLEPIDTAIPVSLIFSHETGFYPEAFSLDITATQTGVKIRYTLDGSVPTDSSPVFEPALIEDQLERYPALAFQIHEPWQAPRHPVPQATVIRAQAFDDQGPRGPLFTRTYWVGEDQANAHNLPVVSLVMEPASLMGYDSGIYVPGATFDRFGWENFIQVGPEWERGADISWLEKNGKVGLQQSIGIRVHGRGSRFGAQKSFRLYARDQYGKARLDYPFFSKNQVQSFKRLLLRTPMADWTRGGLRDMAAHAIIRDMNLEWMDMQPVALYMNGEYWGMYNLRERLDEFYLASHYNLDPDSINIVENDGQIVEGSVRGYRSLLSKLIAGPVPLDSLAQWVDVDAFLDYQIAQHFFANVDWPGTNFRYWQPQTDSGKWRWFFFDLDAGWFYTDLNPVETFAATANNRPIWSVILFQRFMEHQQFRDQYRDRFLHHLATTFRSDRVVSVLDSLQALIAPEMPRQIRRWGLPESLEEWRQTVEDMRIFALRRPFELQRILQHDLGIPIRLGPNPGQDQLNVYLPAPTFLPGEVRVMDISGRVYLSWEGDWETDQVQLQTTSLKPGYYWVQVFDGYRRWTLPWIKSVQ